MDQRERYDIADTAAFISGNGFKSVALQFPDELLSHSPDVASALQHELGTAARVFILADTAYNPLSVDEVAAQHLNADCVVHYGHASLTPVTSLPAFFVLPKEPIDAGAAAQLVCGSISSAVADGLVSLPSAPHGVEGGGGPEEQRIEHPESLLAARHGVLVLLVDQAYQHALPQLEAELAEQLKVPVPLVVARSAARALFPAAAAGACRSQPAAPCCGSGNTTACSGAAPPSAAAAVTDQAPAAARACCVAAAAAAVAAAGQPGAAAGPCAAAAAGASEHGDAGEPSAAAGLNQQRCGQDGGGGGGLGSEVPTADTSTSASTAPAAAAGTAAAADGTATAAQASAIHPSECARQRPAEAVPASTADQGNGAASAPPSSLSPSPSGSCTTHTAIAGLSWTLPAGVSPSSCLYVWLGPQGSSALQVLQLTHSACTWLCADPATGAVSSGLSPDTARLLKRRNFLVEKTRAASILGILVGTLGNAGFKEVIAALRRAAAAADKKTYTFLMGKPNPAKLGNFPEVGVFVMVADPQGLILDSRDYLAPLVTPWEAMTALSGRHLDQQAYRMDFAAALDLAAQIELEQQQRPGGDDDGGDSVGQELAVRALGLDLASSSHSGGGGGAGAGGGRAIVARTAGEYLALKRSYKGLETPLTGAEVKEPHLAVEGLSGRAAVYADEAPRQ